MYPLVSPADLASQLTTSYAPVVLDVRWRLTDPKSGAEDYAKSHIPGAVYLNVDGELSGEPGEGGRHPLPDPAALQKTFRAAGLRVGHPVIAYDDADGSVAARVWWLLRWSGHDEVAILDGGFAAWEAEGRPVTADVPQPEPGDVVLWPGEMPVLDADDAAKLAREGVLFDARAYPRYKGELEPVDPRPGHIPGAVSAPSTDHLADGRWRSPEELQARFRKLGVQDDRAVGAYCGSGVTASSVVLALEVAGHPKSAALYAGSWSHWTRDPQRPAALGSEPG